MGNGYGDVDLAAAFMDDIDDDIGFSLQEQRINPGIMKALQENPQLMKAAILQASTMGGKKPRLATAMPNIEVKANRKDMLGLGQTTVAAGATVDINLTPQALFKPDRLLLGASVALADILVNDIRIGNASQFVATGAVSGLLFQNDTTDGTFNFDTCQVGQIIVVTINNVNAGAQVVSGVFVGETVVR